MSGSGFRFSAASFRLAVLAVLAFPVVGGGASAALTLQGQFDSGLGQPVSLGFDRSTDSVWVYDDFNASLNSFSRGGTPLSTISRPGASSNDADISFAATAFTLNGTLVPAGSLLFINGESNPTTIFAVNKTTGAEIASRTTTFGPGNVVGGAYHPMRNTLFLVDYAANSIAEVNPGTGAVLGSFGLGSFDVFYGDVEVSSVNGNLFVVSDNELSIAEFTPTGTLVQTFALPAGVSDLSGIGLDDGRGQAFVSSRSGIVSQLGGFPVAVAAIPEPSTYALMALGLGIVVTVARRKKAAR